MDHAGRTRLANGAFAAATAPLLLAGLAVAGWIFLWALYSWEGPDRLWLLIWSSVALLALALPVAYLGWYERWQVRNGLSGARPGTAVKAVNWACGGVATLLAVVGAALALLFAWMAWMFWSDDVRAASLYFAVVALAMVAVPVAFLVFYDRWQGRNGLRSR